MKISTNSLSERNKRYGSAGDIITDDMSVAKLGETIGAQLGAVEETIDFGTKYSGVLVVQVVSCADHPNADRLHVCMIDDGGRAQNVERDEQGLVQVVCGAPNVREGLTVAWLPPGSTVPDSYDTEPFVLEARALRGVVSNGMLASPRELALGDSHEGILEIDGDIQPGTPFAEAFNLQGDVIIDIENKMFTHRPDCFGWLGVAREIEGIQGKPFTSPDWYRTDPDIPGVEIEALKLEVRNEIPDLVPRFVAITMRNVKVGPSPVWLQVELARVGVRAINNIVDYTNFFMMLTGQPVHIYDYDKVQALSDADHAVMVIRHPRQGETITLLNGKTIEPRQAAMMVATDRKLICVGGSMGGADTEVDDTTTNIIVEAANWDMFSIRKTSMTHGIFTEAVTRFNKGQSPLQNLAVVAKIVDEIREYAGGKVAGELIDDNHVAPEAMDRKSLHAPVSVRRTFINDRLGFDLSAEAMATLLTNVEFAVDVHDDELTVTAPFWRTDIESREDIVEEVGRLYGFDHLPLNLPQRDLTPAVRNARYDLKQHIRAILARAGANEALTYSFIHGNLLDKVGQKRELAFELSNALSPDLQYYRISLMPSLLDIVRPNIKAGFDEFALFEMNKTHTKLHADDDDGVPSEFSMLAVAYAANDKEAARHEGAAFYEARKLLSFVAAELGLQLVFTPLEDELDIPIMQPYDHRRSALVSMEDGQTLGVIGEFKPSVIKALKLPRYSAGFEVSLDEIAKVANQSSRYLQLPRFPKIEQDLCLRVPVGVTYQDLYRFVWAQLDRERPDKTLHTLGPVDIYQRDGETDYKQITLRLSIASYERTLVTEEVNKLLDDISEAAAHEFQAERI